MKSVRQIILTIALTGFIVSCGSNRNVAVNNNTENNKTTMQQEPTGNWKLVYITGPRIAFDGLYPGKKPTLNFEAENTVSGNSSCNNYSATYALTSGNKIKFSAPASTKMACPGSGENVYFSTLATITGYEITDGGKTLVLLMNDVPAMRFERNTDKP
ncbi:hypothetical protein BAY13_17255 [Elizabethkingia bruuniana]|uniref:META domain-containing protein n=1 Tax=Elizabethkingia bruuniana TaxID=1756149 RepID=UPI00099AE797|nr:META domain-containing protein [Elizabethkingia bruuniana]OPC66480.1 hypothetical protein BAY13_17255 [Elizabethkingia bruuniana]